MKLFYASASPFSRKVLILATEIGLADRIEIVVTNPWNTESLRAVNPLCKIPTLLTDDGVAIYDSRVICVYLDRMSGAGLVEGADTRALVLEALADGIGDAAVRRVVEERRPENDRHLNVIARQTLAIQAGLDAAEKLLAPGAFGIGEIALACALGFLDFRLPHEDWRPGRSGLAAWYAEMEKRPSIETTKPS